MSAASPLPEILELSVHIADSVRFPGSTMRGSLTVSVPTRRSMRVLQGGAEADTDDAAESAAAATSVAAASSSGAAASPAQPPNEGSASDDAARLSSHLLSPLARPFPFELKLQLMSKCVWDPSRLSVHAMRRFAANASGANAFRIWSTRVLNIDVTREDCAQMPRTYEFRVTLPDVLPASFRGVAIKHIYYINVLGVWDGKKIADVKIPFRVRVAQNHTSHSVLETPAGLVSPLHHCLLLPSSAATHTSTLSASPNPPQSVTREARTGEQESQEAVSLLAPNALTVPATAAEESLLRVPSNPRQLPSPLSMKHEEIGGASTLLKRALDISTFSDSTAANGSSVRLLARKPSLPSPTSGLDLLPLSPLEFNISQTVVDRSGREHSLHVVKLTLDSRCTRPGDTVRGHLDFSGAQLRTYRMTVRLEQEESVQEDFVNQALLQQQQQHHQQSGGSSKRSASEVAASLPSGVPPGCVLVSRKSFWTFHAYTVNTLSNHFTFLVPEDAVANCTTDVLAVRWVLRFTFITDAEAGAGQGTLGTTEGGAQQQKHSWSFLPTPTATRAESLHWTLPLTVVPHDDEDVMRQTLLKTVLFSPHISLP